MPLSQKKQLKKFFMHFSQNKTNGITGVLHIKSGIPGPVVGITACTHGNEPAGLAVFDYLLNKINIRKTLLCGELYLVINNLKATKQYFEGDHHARFVDLNMNRLPKNIQKTPREGYEIQRTRKLLPVWKTFTHALDIHSTRSETLPMIIGRKNTFHSELLHGISIKTLISNIDSVQINKPAFSFYGKKDARVFAIEAGSHENTTSFRRATATTVALLKNVGMIPGKNTNVKKTYTEYTVKDSLLFPNMSYAFHPRIKDFKEIQKDTVIASSKNGVTLKMPFNGCVILKTTPENKKDLTEEVAFLTTPKTIRTL